jgi:hypothetical protein
MHNNAINKKQNLLLLVPVAKSNLKSKAPNFIMGSAALLLRQVVT